MGYPKKHRGRRKIGSKKRRARKRNKKRQSKLMELRTQIKKLSLWVFIIPFIAINLCLFISVNFHLFENTFMQVDQIGRSAHTFPYFDGGVSISRTARTYPAYLIFKPSMIISSFLLIIYWFKTNNIINHYQNEKGKINSFRVFGILSAIFLII